jgi:hypothetical protein
MKSDDIFVPVSGAAIYTERKRQSGKLYAAGRAPDAAIEIKRTGGTDRQKKRAPSK